jgi:uncharacterized membrane protein YdjX (TVP38/TMEM64 family)
MKNKFSAILTILIVVSLFILSPYLIKKNIDIVNEIISGYHFFGILIFIFLVIIAVVIAPISATPLIPIASNIWGWQAGTLFSMIGWVSGSFIAFSISRKYGKSLFKKFIPIKKIERIEERVPKEYHFLHLVLLRLIMPVDILSYALGLLTNISSNLFLATTIVGLLPQAFIFSYIGILPLFQQFFLFLIGSILLIILILITIKIEKKKIKRKM